MLNHCGVTAYTFCQKRFDITHSADRVLPHDRAHILQQACETIHNSWNPRQTENPPGSNCRAGNYDVFFGARASYGEAMTTALSVYEKIHHIPGYVKARDSTLRAIAYGKPIPTCAR
jgi:hypothetical protein